MTDRKKTDLASSRTGPFLLGGLMVASLVAIDAAFLSRIGNAPKPAGDPAIERTLERLQEVSGNLYADESRLSTLKFGDALPKDQREVPTLELRVHTQRTQAAQLWQDLGALMELPPPPGDANGLLRFPSKAVERSNYDQVYHPIVGPQPSKMPSGFSFRFDRVIPQADGSLLHRLDSRAGGAIKWERELRRARTQGHYTVEATIERVWPGVVYAPLWLFAEGPQAWGHEYDFELVNGTLEFNLHNGRGGFNMHRVKKDLTGHRMRYEIIRRPGKVTMRATSLTDGWKEELVITPEKVKAWAKQDGAPQGLHFPPETVAMFPVTELWRCRWAEWCGQWRDLPPGTYVDMVVHGYRVDP
ncbi:MAG: hypothetical protein CVT79_14855 [Alphaproteobacteria bacterium HGW-Alphaproteobacteria-18]|nr:MAG: hypothetical protein CVT79_14855 [Alphaproteobacteria bacterium HGW-Alphaproteobacteria-18]